MQTLNAPTKNKREELDSGIAEMLFVSSVTAPVSEITRPSTFTPVVSVLLERAIIVPVKIESVPRVTELPT